MSSSLSQRASDPVNGQAVIAHLYGPIRDDLERVREAYRKELSNDDPYLANLLKYIEDYSGKMLRPALLLLAAKACGDVKHEHIVLAVVSEMLHTATLVHDDVLDDALIRRQRASINQLAGTEISILLGDHLFSHALELALSIDDPTGAHRLSRAVSRTCLGEITQVFNRGNLNLDEETYYRIVRGKTAELYATSAELGAYYAGAGEDGAKGMYDYGLCLGVAFQIMDDLLDLRGDEGTVGKTLGTDLANLKATLPVIHYLASATTAKREEALKLLQEGQSSESARNKMLELLRSSDSLEYAEKKAHEHINRAKESIAFLGEHPMRVFFSGIADFVISREL